MDLVLITKDGIKLRIHPDALAEHVRLGWMQMPDEQAEDNPVRRGRKPQQA